MSEPTLEERIATLEAKVQTLENKVSKLTTVGNKLVALLKKHRKYLRFRDIPTGLEETEYPEEI